MGNEKSSSGAPMSPSSNKIPLNQALVDELKTLQNNIRENTISLAQRAYEIRSQYLAEDGRRYDAEFHKWWAAHDLETVFGKLPNFTKYAEAGEALEKAQLGEYRDRMPITLTALHQIAQLTPDELKLCVQDTYTRLSLTDTPKARKTPKPLIHPETTAAEIKAWKNRWRNPKPKPTEKRRLPYATLKVHGSLYDFDNKGTHSGILTVGKLKKIHDALINSMKPFNEYVLLETRFDALIEGHNKREEQAQERKRKKAAEKKIKKPKR